MNEARYKIVRARDIYGAQIVTVHDKVNTNGMSVLVERQDVADMIEQMIRMVGGDRVEK